MIHIGETNILKGDKLERIEIPVFHTGVFGQSGTGKTTLLKYMIGQVVKEGYRVLIFDSKLTQPEFEGIGTVVPFYLQENTDPDVYRSLIEGVRSRGRGDMEKFRAGFIELCEPDDKPKAQDYGVIERRLKAKLDDHKTIKGWTRGMYSEIYHDHLKLKGMLAGHKFSTVVPYSTQGPKIMRMPTRDLPNLNLQGLVVRSTVEALLRGAEKLIFLVDEAPNFVNQRQYNPAKSALQQLDSQGRGRELFGWYSGQTLSGFDKANMKNLWYWIMGREMERNEVSAILETQTDKVLTRDQIKKLKVREFIVSTPDWTKLVIVPKIEPASLASLAREDDQPRRPVQLRIRAVATSQREVGTKRMTQPERAEARATADGAGAGVSHPGLGLGTSSGETPDASHSELEEIHLDEKQLIIKVSHSEKVVPMTTETQNGQVIFLLKEAGSGNELGIKEIVDRGAEHGWALPYDTLRKSLLPDMAKEGLAIGDGHGNYRLPKFVIFDVKKVQELVA